MDGESSGKKAIVVDSEGVVQVPYVHDDTITFIEIGDDWVTIGFVYPFSTPHPVRPVVHFAKVDCFACSPLIRGNISDAIELRNCPITREGWLAEGFFPAPFLDEYYRFKWVSRRYAYLGATYGARIILAGDFEDSDITWEELPPPAEEAVR